jgi:hypothetical protein
MPPRGNHDPVSIDIFEPPRLHLRQIIDRHPIDIVTDLAPIHSVRRLFAKFPQNCLQRCISTA